MKRSDLDTVTVLRIIDGKGAGGVKVTDLIAAAYPEAPAKLILAKLEQLAQLGFIEYGVVITRPWLTDAGRQRVAGTAGPET